MELNQFKARHGAGLPTKTASKATSACDMHPKHKEIYVGMTSEGGDNLDFLLE